MRHLPVLGLILIGFPAQGLAANPHAPLVPREQPPSAQLAEHRDYVGRFDRMTRSPPAPAHVPAGASARCDDGSYSFDLSRQRACTHHGGIAAWLKT